MQEIGRQQQQRRMSDLVEENGARGCLRWLIVWVRTLRDLTRLLLYEDHASSLFLPKEGKQFERALECSEASKSFHCTQELKKKEMEIVRLGVRISAE